jgi:putative tryptophan/tyrosine transport system substrate-binding protein
MLPRSWLGQRMQFDRVKRREFITLIGGAAAAWPLTAIAQQPATPVIGFLNPGSAADFGHHAEGFLQGLKQSGFTEGENITVEYHWAEGRYERLPQHAQELVKHGVAVIAVGSAPAIFAAKSATSTIPIVFIAADDPVKDGFVASFNRPSGNLTGVTVFTTAPMWNKRLELLNDLTPNAASVAMLVNPRDPANPDMTEMMLAARKLGLGLSFLTASTDAAALQIP